MRPTRALRTRAVQLFIATLLCFSFAVGCEGIDLNKANKNVGEANKLLKEGDEIEQEAGKFLTELDTAENPEKAKASAAKCVTKFEEAVVKYEEAAKLTKTASAMKVTKMFAEYLELKGKQFAKFGDGAVVWQKFCKAVADTGAVTQADVVKAKADASKLREEADELGAKAKKIQDDNPDQFSKND